MEAIDLTGSTLDIENDHISDKTKKTYLSALAQLMMYLFDNNKKLLIVANNEDEGNANRKILRRECLKQLKEMSRENKRSPIKIEGRRKFDYEVITKCANAKKEGSYSE